MGYRYFLYWLFLNSIFLTLWSQKPQLKLEKDEVIKIKEIQRTDYRDQSLPIDRETPYLSNQNSEEESQFFGSDLPERAPSKETAVFSNQFSQEYEAYLEYGLGDHFYSWLDFKKISHLHYLNFKLLGLSRKEIFSLDRDPSGINNSHFDRIDFDLRFMTGAGSHRLWFYERYFTIGLQKFSPRSEAKYFSLGLEYSFQTSFDLLVLKNRSKLLWGYHKIDPFSVDQLNQFLVGGTDWQLIFKGDLAGLKINFLYHLDFSTTQVLSRHLGKVALGYSYYFNRDFYLDLGLSSVITYSESSEEKELDFFPPIFVLPEVGLTLKWNQYLTYKWEALLKVEQESFSDFYYSLITVKSDQLPQLNRLARGKMGLQIHGNAWISGEISGWYDFYFVYDRIRLSHLKQKYFERIKNRWNITLQSELNLKIFEWVKLSSKLRYRFSIDPPLFPTIVNQNQILFNIPMIYSTFSIDFDYSYRNYLQMMESRIRLDKKVLSAKYQLNYPENFFFSLEVRNLLNDDYFENGDFMIGEKRNLFLGVKYSF